jgi:hypothetical protein
LARPFVLILHLFWLADAINFKKDYSPPVVRHLDPTVVHVFSHHTVATLVNWPDLSSPVPSPLSLLRLSIQRNRERKDVVEPVTLLPISKSRACQPEGARQLWVLAS